MRLYSATVDVATVTFRFIGLSVGQQEKTTAACTHPNRSC